MDRRELTSFTTDIPEGVVGIAQIERFTISKAQAGIENIKNPRQRIRAGEYVRLLIKGSLVMANTPRERRTCMTVMLEAWGDVLIFGLGLGLILPPILANKDVHSVTVVELYEDVIDLVGPHVQHPKLTIFRGDACSWEPPNGEKYDYIFFDIWDAICGDYYEETKTLHKRIRKFRRKGGETHSWCREKMRRLDKESACYFGY